MKLPKINTEKVKEAGTVVGLALLAIVGNVAKNTLQNAAQMKINAKIYEKASYSSVITTIINSDMWSSDKERLIEIIPKDADPQLYGSITAIVLGDMWSADKLRTIEKLCRNKEA